MSAALARSSAALAEAPDHAPLYLHPGRIIAAREPSSIITILGTCVSVCLFDPVAQVGGMNHYLLARSLGRAERTPRYGEVAIPELLAQLLGQGARLERLRAKVFGGMAGMFESASAGRIGEENIALAIEFLQRAGIEVVASDVGGSRGRKLLFHTDDGSAWVKQV